MSDAAVARGAEFASAAARLWPKGPSFVPPAVFMAMALLAMAVAIARIPPKVTPQSQASDANPETGASTAQVQASTAQVQAQTPQARQAARPEREKAARAAETVRKAARSMADPELKKEAQKLVQALDDFASGKIETPELLAAAQSFTRQAEEVAKEAQRPETMRSISPDLLKTLARNPLLAAMAKAMLRKDYSLASDALKDLLSHLTPEEARQLAEQFKDLAPKGGLGPGGLDAGASVQGVAGTEPEDTAGEGKSPDGQTGKQSPRPESATPGPAPQGEAPTGPKASPQEAARPQGEVGPHGGPQGEAGPPPDPVSRMADAFRATEVTKVAQDAAEAARAATLEQVAKGTGASREGTLAKGGQASKEASSDTQPSPGGTGQAGTGEGPNPFGTPERMDVKFKDEKLALAPPVTSVRDAVRRASLEGPTVPGFKEVVERYREVSPEDMARAALPAPLRAMVEAYFDRLAGRKSVEANR